MKMYNARSNYRRKLPLTSRGVLFFLGAGRDMNARHMESAQAHSDLCPTAAHSNSRLPLGHSRMYTMFPGVWAVVAVLDIIRISRLLPGFGFDVTPPLDVLYYSVHRACHH